MILRILLKITQNNCNDYAIYDDKDNFDNSLRVLKSDDDIEENAAIDDHSYKHNLGIDCFPVNDTPLTQIQQIHSRPIDIFVKKYMRKCLHWKSKVHIYWHVMPHT